MERRVWSRNVVQVTLAVFAVTAGVGVGADRWYAAVLLREQRQQVQTVMLPYAHGVADAVELHVSRMGGLAAFVSSLSDRSQLEREFDLYAGGLMASVPGIRAIQVVRDGRVAMVYPLTGNAGALGLRLRDSDNASTRAGYARAMATKGVWLLGPTPLVQGGEALVLDERVHAPYDQKIEFVAMLVDVPTILNRLAFDSLPAGFAFELRDAAGRTIDNAGGPLPDAPVRLVAKVRDGDWTLLGGPTAGWGALVSRRLVPVRLAIVAIVGLLTVLGAQIAGRDARLTRAVEERTASLKQLADERRQTIVQLQETERALAANEQHLQLALEAAKAATFELDVATGDLRWSPEFALMLDLTPAEVPHTLEAGIAWMEPTDVDALRKTLWRARQGPSHGALEFRVKRASGVPRWVGITWISRTDETGMIRQFVGTFTDITERKSLEERFLHAQKMEAMGALAGGIAHDFNNLLTVILGAGGMARVAADAPGMPDAMRADINDVLAAGERAAMLTGQLLAFSRRQVVQSRRFDAGDFVGGMGTMLRRLVGERIQVETALPAAKVPLFADQGLLTQVVMNLAVNARDAMPNGGVLRISLRTDAAPGGAALPNEALVAHRFAVLSVSDTGTGIDPSIAPQIFDPFFTTKPVGQGTGLGLSTVYGIVMQMGGTVRLTTEVGRGTTFDVYVPLAAPDERWEESVATGPALAVPSGGRTVLLAEDEPGTRRVVERVLTGAGYHLIVAEDGDAALAAAHAYEGAIDLLITDVVMPGTGGVKLAAELSRARPTLRVLFMSGYPKSVGPGDDVSLADTPFLAKPFKPNELLAAARRALAES